MSKDVAKLLERNFGAASVTRARVRFDGPELPMLAPISVEGFREALVLAQREKWTLVPTGLGSKLSWCAAPARADFLLSTWAFSGVEAYESGDGTISARAGTTLAELRARAAAGGHALVPDVPRPRRATLGGVIAAAQSGSDRLRYGPLRDHVLGIEVALADGTLANSGGRLVKNVTGYDLQRLYTGSNGCLCLILGATLRLFPLPQEECQVLATAVDRAQLVRLANAALAAPVRPISLCAGRIDPARDGAQWLLALQLGGRAEVVAAERTILESLWPGSRCVQGDEARQEAELLRDKAFDEIDGPLLRAYVRPAAFALALEVLERLLELDTREGVLQPRWWLEPGVARIDVALRPQGEGSRRIAQRVVEARAALAPLQGRVQLLHAAGDVGVAPFGPIEAGAQLMADLGTQLDPTGVFDSGRFHARSLHGPR